MPEFFALEDVLDTAVGRAVQVEVQRGSTTMRHAINVESLSS